jgi:hypothetical protein
VAIDVSEPSSPGWWMWRLAEEHRKRYRHLDDLWERYCGRPPLPEGMEAAGPIFQRFAKKSRLNVAELAVQAVLDRLSLVGFRVGDEQTTRETFDQLAARIWVENEMPIEGHDLHEFVGVMGRGYTIVGPRPEGEELPVITAEDPREVITAHDPARRSRTLAGLKLMYDAVEEVDRAYLYLPGATSTAKATVYRARRAGRPGGGSALGRSWRFSPRGWDWENLDEPDTLPTADVPVIRYENHRGAGEFEGHIDVCDRIDHMILQRMVIATLQAFRQRAIKGLPRTDPKTGEEIDYDKIFSADPGALWQLPATAEMWESGQVDLSPILNAVKDDVQQFAALTRTPLSYFVPDAANGSAEGASLTREGLVFKTEDRQMRNGVGHARTMALALRYAGQDQAAARVTPVWGPAERYSLAQRYDAALKAVTAGVPWKTRMLDVLQFTPVQVERMEMERMGDTLVAPAPADTGTGGAPQPDPAPEPEPAPDAE